MIINLTQITVDETKPKGPIASLTPVNGITYTEGFSGLDAETISLFCGLISNNASINNETGSVYIDYKNEHRKFSIGDQVSLSLNGANYAFDVIGFNHDDLTNVAIYGEPTVTGKAGITFQMHDLYATIYVMNSTSANNNNTNSGGWKSCAMRTSTMVTMKDYLPDDWETIIKPVNKVSGIGGGSTSGTETVSDSCFLLSEVEVRGSIYSSVSGEGAQYAYYKAGNSKVKNRNDSAYGWWLRSPRSGNSTNFCRVTSWGSFDYNGPNVLDGVAFAFCVQGVAT